MAEDKRIRKKNFSADELIWLRENYTKHREMLQSKFTNSLTNKMKNDAWKEITSSVNALGVEMRGTEEVRKKKGMTYAHLQSWHIMRFTRTGRRLGVHLFPTYRRRQHTLST